MRLSQILFSQGFGTRRLCAGLIQHGEVSVRGEVVSSTFDRVQFNFPHWRGKANNRYNRILLGDFLASASTVLSPGGEIHVALCDGQGG